MFWYSIFSLVRLQWNTVCWCTWVDAILNTSYKVLIDYDNEFATEYKFCIWYNANKYPKDQLFRKMDDFCGKTCKIASCASEGKDEGTRDNRIHFFQSIVFYWYQEISTTIFA